MYTYIDFFFMNMSLVVQSDKRLTAVEEESGGRWVSRAQRALSGGAGSF